MGSHGATRRQEFSAGAQDARKVRRNGRQRRQERETGLRVAQEFNAGEREAVADAE